MTTGILLYCCTTGYWVWKKYGYISDLPINGGVFKDADEIHQDCQRSTCPLRITSMKPEDVGHQNQNVS